MKKNEQTFELKIRAVLDGMDKVVQELNKGLKEGTTKIDASKGIGKGLTKQIENFKEEYSKLTELTKGDKFEIADTKEVLRSGEAIIGAFKEIKRIIGDFDDLTLLDAKKLFPDAFNSQVEETRQKFEGLRRSLIDLSDKKIRLDEATNELSALKTQQEELFKTLEEQRSVVVDTQGAQQELDGAIAKVQELKDELREVIGQKLSTVQTSTVNLEAERAQILAAREARGAAKPTMTSNAATRAKLPQEQIDAISLYESEQARLKEIGAQLEENSKKAKKFRDVLLGDQEKTSLNDLAKTAEASTKKIKEVTEASKNLTNAQKKQKDTKSQFEAQAAAIKKTEAEYEGLTGQIERQEGEVKKLQTSYDNLKDKINPDDLKRAFSELNIDFSEDIVRDEQAVEGLREKLNKLEQQDFDRLITQLKQMGVNVDNTEELVKQLKVAFGGAKEAAQDFTETQKEIDRLKNSIKEFFSITNTISLLKRTVNSATESIKALDAVMTEAAVVTDFSIGDMWEQMPQYSKNASELGVATKDLYAATTLYYQQGLKGNEVLAVGAETMKMAKIASMDTTEATQAMTAALRGFNMQVDEMNAQKVNDVYSKLAAITAADTSQIATAMGKTASIAASANMEFETTAAFLAQIIETTQEAPETAGTALKTIVARFSEVKDLQNKGIMSGVDTEGEAIDINKISTALRSVGISMDAFFAGQEGLDDVLLRLSQKWDALDFKTQRYIATTAAGSRQQSRFIAMMSNYGRTMELVGAANDSAGASQEQYEKTLDSLESKLTQLKNAWEQFTMGLANNELLKFGVDTLTWILETVNKLTDAISGGSGLVKSIASLMTVVGALKLGKGALDKTGFGSRLLGAFGKSKVQSDENKRAYQRGYKRGEAERKGYTDAINGLAEDTSQVTESINTTTEEGKKSARDMTTEFNKASAAMLGIGAACGLLATAFKKAGMDEAAEAAGALATTFSILGSVIPAVSKILVAAGVEVSMAWWQLTLIAAAIAAIVGVIYVSIQAAKRKTLEYKLEQTKKATEEARIAAEEAKTAYDDLLNTKNKYSDTQDALKKLTKGTREWRAALLEANQQVLEIQEKYSHLDIRAETGDNGLLTLSEDSWTKIEEHLLQISQANQAAYVGGQIETDSLGVDILRRDLNELKSTRDRLQATRDEAELAYANLGQINYNQTNPYYAAWSAQYEAIADLDKNLEDFDRSIEEQTQKYNEAMDALNEKLGLYAQSLTGYVSKETSESSFYTKAGLAIAKNKGIEIESQIDTRTGELVSEYYRKEPALRALYKQTFGREPGEEATTETMARELATVDVSKSVSGQVDQVVGLIEKIQDQSTQRVVAAALSGDSSGLTMGELDKLKTMDQWKIALELGFTPDKVGDFEGITGLTGNMVQRNKQDYGSTYEDLYGKIGSKVYNQNENFLSGLSIETLGSLTNQTGFDKMNDAQKTALITSLQEVLSDNNLAEGEANILGNLLTSTDWTDPLKAMDTMDTMLSMGIDQDTIQEYWDAATAGVDAYVDSETEALQLAGRMQGKVKNLGELSNRMAEGALTVDDMVMLEKAGVNTSNYKLTAEGWQATSEEIAEATDKMREFYLMQAREQKDEIIREMVLNSTSEERKAELQDTLDIVKKTIEMLEQPITTTYKVETHIDLLDRIKKAIVFDRQKEIDKLSEINDTIADSNSRIVTAMRESVEASRRARENERMEQEIADKQSRLAYLKMDTSGANAMEIKRLEEEIAQDQESYTDKLIDEKISALEEQNNIAQEQRAQQIELMQLQLERVDATGALWGQVNELFNAAYNSETGELDENSEAIRLLQQAEGYQGLSAEAQQQWKDDLLSAFKEGVKVEVDVKVEFMGGGGATSSRDILGLGPGISKNIAVQKFASGGLADFTGPAWLDGTKTNPEYVLSAAQTERFFTLVDILEGLKVAPANSTQNNRENNFDIDINVESINSDYDVEQVAIKVKDFIVNSSRYRNNNTL